MVMIGESGRSQPEISKGSLAMEESPGEGGGTVLEIGTHASVLFSGRRICGVGEDGC